jgi:23S rRNA (uracil1939-C5)-methyltransferase
MGIKSGQEIELWISDMAFGGKGVSKPDDFTIFVDQAVPQDHVAARITRKKKNYAEARMIRLITPSPHRISPPCPYSGYCGGCKWQFLKYEAQLEYKRQHVSDALEHIGLIRGVPVHPAIPSDRIFGYRNKMEFSCADHRWLMPHEMGSDADTHFAIGLHVPGTFHKVLDISACMLHPEAGNAILEDVRQFIRNSREPVYGLRSHTGFWRFVMLRHSSFYDRWMVNIITSTEKREAVRPLADLLMEKHPEIVSVVNNVTGRSASVAVGEYEILLAGEPVLKEKIGDLILEISANSFFQTNTRGAEKLYETAKNYAELRGTETVLDLYCGTGTIAMFLSNAAREVAGVELIQSAVSDAWRNCQANGISNCRFIQGDIKDCLPRIGVKPDVMVIDPPRAGMHKDVVRQILDAAPPRIVYVSCNPATLARDLALLNEQYAVQEVQPVDMFPHTFHVESVARLALR